MLDTINDSKRFRHISIVLYSAPHIVMKRLNESKNFEQTT